jgi:outer membrane protein assembly factor BamB
MRTLTSLAFLLCFLAATSVRSADSSDAKNFWPQWRGPLATGEAPNANPPTEWSETKNVKWKVKLPGLGGSTPIVWGNKVFILTAVPTGKHPEKKTAALSLPEQSATGNRAPYGDGTNVEVPPARRQPGEPGNFRRGPGGPGGFRGGPGGRGETPDEIYQFVVLCYDRNTGKKLWEKVAREEVPHEGKQQNNTYASASPVTDGQLLFAYFGSRGLYCYDLDGNLKWSKDFGKMQTRNGFGEGASPAVHGDRIVVYWDDEKDADFITALDKKTGKEIWKTPRSEETGWSTPFIIDHGGKTQIIVNASGKVRSYNFADGKELWSCGGQTANAIPAPVADASTVYVTSGFRGSALHAIALDKTGDLTGTEAIRWSYNRNTPYVPSPLLADGSLYFVKGNDAIISNIDAKTGKLNFEAERLEDIRQIYASPVSARDRVYVLGREGECVVLKRGPKLEILATNKLNDHTDASIALVGKELFIRGAENLYCIAEK